MAKFSILLTTYNRPHFLAFAVDSVVKQTYEDWECIILDDNSSNKKQLELLDAYEKLPKFKVYRSDVTPEDRTKTTRYATLINKGLDMAKGEYIAYLCDDDRFLPTKLEKALEKLSEPGIMAVYGKQLLKQVNDDGTEEDYVNPERSPSEIFRTGNSANCRVDHSSVIHHIDCFKAAGYWDDDPGWWGSADGIYWDKLHEAGVAFHPINEFLDVHVYHEGSVTKEGNWQKLGTEEEYVQFTKK